jgi:hypothetical protein
MDQKLTRQLARLAARKGDYGPGCDARMADLLRSFRSAKFRKAQALIQFHDILLFLRAFPQGPAVVLETEALLASVRLQVGRFLPRDEETFEPENVSGIAGTTISDPFTYEVARWLSQSFPADLSAEWDEEEQSARLATTLPRFLPLLEEDSLVEAGVPYLEWLRAAAGGNDLGWLMRRFEALPLTMAEKTELYDALGITLRWAVGDAQSRTLARWPAQELFFHDEPLIERKEVSLAQELASSDVPVRKLTVEEGARLLDTVRTAVTVRYRELYGTTRGDATQVIEATPGRGVQIFLWGLPPDRRLPLRAYHAGLTVKNGVPIGYIEDIGLFEWVEVGFNTFYAYRDGESAWIYSKILHLFHQLYGYTCFSVYPYQIGLGNEEAIKSGAFWFYRKLGFRPGRPELLSLVEKEERKIARSRAHRTSPVTLRKLAGGHVFYEMPGTERGLWDRFSMRKLGLQVQRRMAERFAGDATQMRRTARGELARVLECDPSGWEKSKQTAFDHFAATMMLVPGMAEWTGSDKQALLQIIRSKGAAEETEYLRRMQAHARLKRAILELASAAEAAPSGAKK